MWLSFKCVHAHPGACRTTTYNAADCRQASNNISLVRWLCSSNLKGAGVIAATML